MLEPRNSLSGKSLRILRLQRITAAALVAITLTILYWNKLFTYSVGGDDYSLIESSRSFDIHNWLFSGFSDYFYVFDGSSPYTNFIRPVVNISFWLNNHLFSEKPGLYFLSTILFISFYCYSLLCLAGFRMLGILLISIFCLASPSIAQASLGSPPFAFDVLAAAFVLAAIYASLRNKPYIGICLLFLAVFTKEIGLVACIAFAVCSAIQAIVNAEHTRSKRLSSWTILYLSPVATYAIIRYIGVGIGGTYSTNDIGLRSLLNRAIRFPFTFPTGLAANLSGYRDLIFSGNFIGFIIRLGPLLLNILIFIGSAWMVARYVAKYRKIGLRPRSNANNLVNNNILILCVLCLTSLYLSLMGADGRFFPLPQGCLLILLARGIDYEVINSQITRIAMISLLAIYSFMFVSHAKSALAFRPSNVDAILAGVIQKAKQSNSARILLVNAPDIYSSPRYVLKYHRFNGDLDFLYNSKGSCGPYPRYTLLNKEESSGLAYVIRPMKDKTHTLPSEGCNPEIAFNGYAVKQTDNKGINNDVDSFFVSGNQFRFSRAQRGSPKKLKSINISRQYDAIYVANYETGEVRLLAPVDGAS